MKIIENAKSIDTFLENTLPEHHHQFDQVVRSKNESVNGHDPIVEKEEQTEDSENANDVRVKWPKVAKECLTVLICIMPLCIFRGGIKDFLQKLLNDQRERLGSTLKHLSLLSDTTKSQLIALSQSTGLSGVRFWVQSLSIKVIYF